MAALPADIAKYTNDGKLLIVTNPAVKGAHPEATDELESEIEMFFKDEAPAAGMLAERFAILSRAAPLHLGIEVAEDVGLGLTIPIAARVPCFNVIDDENGVRTVGRVRAYTYETASDRYSLEVIE